MSSLSMGAERAMNAALSAAAYPLVSSRDDFDPLIRQIGEWYTSSGKGDRVGA